MLTSFWTWLNELTGGAATFVGSVVGFVFGSITLVLGALFNAHLNRKRDDRLREQEINGIMTALLSELALIERAFLDLAREVRNQGGFPTITIPDPKDLVRVFPQITSKIGLLDYETTEKTLTAYGCVMAFSRKLAISGENRVAFGSHVVVMPTQVAEEVAQDSQRAAAEVSYAVGQLKRKLGLTER